MAMKRCKANLHFYDADKNKEGCPYCRNIDDPNVSGTGGIGETVGETMGGTSETQGSTHTASTAGYHHDRANSGSTIGNDDPSDLDAGKTIGIYQTPEGEDFEPVVGWLVCTEGPNKGRDYKICARANSNFISRVPGKNISIVISSDNSISRDQHAEILYDQDDNTFSLIRKVSPAVKLNNKKVKVSEDLKAYDEITLGTSKFHFVPYCIGEIKWEG